MPWLLGPNTTEAKSSCILQLFTAKSLNIAKSSSWSCPPKKPSESEEIKKLPDFLLEKVKKWAPFIDRRKHVEPKPQVCDVFCLVVNLFDIFYRNLLQKLLITRIYLSCFKNLFGFDTFYYAYSISFASAIQRI